MNVLRIAPLTATDKQPASKKTATVAKKTSKAKNDNKGITNEMIRDAHFSGSPRQFKDAYEKWHLAHCHLEDAAEALLVEVFRAFPDLSPYGSLDGGLDNLRANLRRLFPHHGFRSVEMMRRAYWKARGKRYTL